MEDIPEEHAEEKHPPDLHPVVDNPPLYASLPHFFTAHLIPSPFLAFRNHRR